MKDYRLAIDFVPAIGYDQNEMFWDAIRNQHIEYIFFDITCTSAEIGTRAFKSNYEMARKNKLKIGIKKQFESSNIKSAIHEAELLLFNLEQEHIQLDLPIFIEFNTNAQIPITNQKVAEIIQAFASVIKERSSYKIGLYLNSYWYYNHIDFRSLCKYDVWYTCPDGIGDIRSEDDPDMDIAAYHFTNSTESIFPCAGISKFYKNYFVENNGKKRWFIINNMDNSSTHMYFKTSEEYISNDWLYQNGKWFYFDQCGHMVTDVYYTCMDSVYYIDKQGILHKMKPDNSYQFIIENAAFKYHGMLMGLI